jgi:hypothetical protein
VGELFGVELVDGVVDGALVGEVDASLGEGGGDLFGGAPGGFVVEGVLENRQVGLDRLDDRAAVMSKRANPTISESDDGKFPESLAGAEVCDIDPGEKEFVFHGEWLT